MARIRSIKPTIWADTKFIGLSRDARLLYIGIISNADDDGRFVATPAALVGAVFAHDDIKPATVKAWRDELSKCGLIVVYREGSGTYGHLPKWADHQVIRKHLASSLPAPPPPLSAVPGDAPSTAPSDSPSDDVRTA